MIVATFEATTLVSLVERPERFVFLTLEHITSTPTLRGTHLQGYIQPSGEIALLTDRLVGPKVRPQMLETRPPSSMKKSH